VVCRQLKPIQLPAEASEKSSLAFTTAFQKKEKPTLLSSSWLYKLFKASESNLKVLNMLLGASLH